MGVLIRQCHVFPFKRPLLYFHLFLLRPYPQQYIPHHLLQKPLYLQILLRLLT